MAIYSDFVRIMQQETSMQPQFIQNKYSQSLFEPSYFINVARRVLEIAKNGTISRCGNYVGHLSISDSTYESDGSHTNLMRALVNYAFDYIYGWDISPPTYNRREIDEAVLLHDLPENETGDTPDNGSRDETAKMQHDKTYYEDFLHMYAPYESNSCFYISKLLQEMEDKSTEEGRILYVADKLSAIIMMLAYDELGLYPHAFPDDEFISDINRAEMNLCEMRHNDGYLLSELWTVDFLYARELAKFDDSGFFLAILVMTTLLVHGKWYHWREGQYIFMP